MLTRTVVMVIAIAINNVGTGIIVEAIIAFVVVSRMLIEDVLVRICYIIVSMPVVT